MAIESEITKVMLTHDNVKKSATSKSGRKTFQLFFFP